MYVLLHPVHRTVLHCACSDNQLTRWRFNVQRIFAASEKGDRTECWTSCGNFQQPAQIFSNETGMQ